MKQFSTLASYDICERLKKSPLFFLSFHYKQSYNGTYMEDSSTWESEELQINLSVSQIGRPQECRDLLFVFDNVAAIEQDHSDNTSIKYTITFHAVGANNESDWKLIFDNYIYRSNDKLDKLKYKELLWTLNYRAWSVETILIVLKQYDKNLISYIWGTINNIAGCLSEKKQKAIKTISESLGFSYNIYMPPTIHDAYMSFNQADEKLEERNLFYMVDYIFHCKSTNTMSHLVNGTTNPLLIIYRWLQDSNEKLSDYSIIKSCFSMVSEMIRLKIVKRYFHDVRFNRTAIDWSLIEQFKDNDYIEFMRYRECIINPASAFSVITVPLLIDCILTLQKSKGRSFQTLNGLLDLAMTHNDITTPYIDLRLARILPSCKGNAIYNPSFKGFIDYKLICSLNEEQLSEDSLNAYIKSVLNKCHQNETLSEHINIKEEHEGEDNNHWNITAKCMEENPLLYEMLKIENTCSKELLITQEMISAEKYKKYVLEKLNKAKDDQSEEDYIFDSKTIYSDEFQFIEPYLKKEIMRIYPQGDVYFGIEADCFGIWAEMILKDPSINREDPKDYPKEAVDRFKEKECAKIKNIVLKTLSDQLNSNLTNDYYDVPYDRLLLDEILDKYYYRSTGNDNFLMKVSKNRRIMSCAPKYADGRNSAVNLPFYWCMGKACYQNCLNKQTLDNCSDWKLYSLYHISEIIGYKKIHKTDAGYESDDSVRLFIALANKLVQMYKHLKCRSCGHLLFTERDTAFNRNNYYMCLNPSCTQFHQTVYLNFCFSCKHSIIDSRDTKKCPNGWYICPDCLSCCNDAQYDSLGHRYIMNQQSVPTWIQDKLHKGHNNKDQYFCPYCGGPIEIIDEHDEKIMYCPSCHKRFYFSEK